MTRIASPKTDSWRNSHLIYYLLAGLNLLTVMASFGLNHRMRLMFIESVQVNREWAARLNRYSQLGQSAGAVNAPGNNVFDSRDVRQEEALLVKALAEFNAQIAAARSEVSTVPGEQGDELLAHLAKVEAAMQEMVTEARLIFSFFGSQQVEKAGERMATMDRKFA